jgi:hypothetical protein
MPRHCSANSRGAAIPATVRRCVAWSATTPWHCATHSRTVGAPHPREGTAEPSKGRRTTMPCPCRYNAVTPGRRDRSPPSPSALCDYPRHPKCHPGHCITIPDTVEACSEGTPPRQLLYPRTASCQQHPRVLTQAVAEQEIATLPPSKSLLGVHRMRHDTPPEARFARTAIYSTTLYSMPLHVGEIVRHACKLPPPWPIKGGQTPSHWDDGRRSLTRFPPSPRYWHLPQSVSVGPGGPTSSPASLVAPLYEHHGATQYSAPNTPLLDVRPPAGTRIKTSVTSCVAPAIERSISVLLTS